MSINPDELINIEGMGGITPFERPVAGQSLTNDPDSKYPWEKPPEFTEVQGAIMSILADSYEKETYEMVALSIADGMPVGDLASMILQAGFQEGKWNPDLMLMLVEPLIFVLMSLAEKAGIEYRIDSEDDDDDDTMFEERAKNIADVAKEKLQNSNKSPAGLINQEILQKIEEAEVPQSLLSKGQ